MKGAEKAKAKQRLVNVRIKGAGTTRRQLIRIGAMSALYLEYAQIEESSRSVALRMKGQRRLAGMHAPTLKCDSRCYISEDQ